MAFEGVLQWAQAVVDQARRVSAARDFLFSPEIRGSIDLVRVAMLQSQTEYHYFCIAANKFLEYRDWAVGHNLYCDVDFSEVDKFSRRDIKDLRNMREHIVEYFQGNGKAKDRWWMETPAFKADASSIVGTLIGGRLDWAEFANATERLLPTLYVQPIPFSSPHRIEE